MPGFILTMVTTEPAIFAMAAPPGGGTPWAVLLPYAAIGAIFYFIIMRPMRQRQKKVSEFRDALKVGDKIITTSGIYGSITKLNDRSVQLQVADKVRIEVSRAAVGGLQGQDPVVQDSGSM
ncbi:MAG: preprotein translocase subunit YajC [Vicinamibacterales bacterium]